MSDFFGDLQFPVQVPGATDSVHDPALDKIGAYLAACLNANLNASWGAVNPGQPFVKVVQTNSPSDSTFNEKDLPALFLWRNAMNNEQTTDDWTEVISDVTLLWVPQNAVQAKRSLRSPGVNGFTKVVTRALELGRTPAWIDAGDTDPTAATLGSVLLERARLFRWPYLTNSKYDTVTIQKGNVQGSYSAFTANLRISEITNWDESFDSITGSNRDVSKLDETITQGPGFQLEALIPTS